MTTTTDTTARTLDALLDGPPTVSIEAAGEYFGVSRAYAYTLAKNGHIPTIRLGVRRLRVPAAALHRLLTEGETEVN
ncbi:MULTISPECIES: helix-turn-helix domain-containing protein [Gordonia]|uniref:helix-turn-helix domain-containing protein n=1 Tax=Gordonia TaxID=2053 RepID=UPI0012BB40DF|nr:MULTISPECIES: helix-turn-helix domain-containing protein [Gordonia]MDH3009490.1 helix-turn-helix domain-containing protein [Gordonia alkanivorans]MDH3018325.1 helix-turn-helix domain-containing protein [Gordonia alkanivorans]MDH3043715.1 helix-turn-helix domain-containing protein [Gordonia alkanivorans]MDH3048083.1 helix-turn-helix domain-containing protein [Gordonia alkanivorans]QGP89143.1 excisionase family DNA-binding protein [Gordonia sp. 135]